MEIVAGDAGRSEPGRLNLVSVDAEFLRRAMPAYLPTEDAAPAAPHWADPARIAGKSGHAGARPSELLPCPASGILAG